MKIIIDQADREDVVIEEVLEPTISLYSVSQNGHTVYLSKYQLEEFVRASKMFLDY